MAHKKINVGNINKVREKTNIAGGNIYKGYTAEHISALLTQIKSTFQPKPFDGRCPYKGLDTFEEEDAELFFGRERLIEDLVTRVKESRTVFITGPSGSGKSSLVRAGLIHALKQGAIKNLHSERWLYETMKPGRGPLEALELAFSRLKFPELANYFRRHVNETNILNECAESVLSGRKGQRFVLFIDQFEEIFLPAIKETERVAFLKMLAHAAIVENGRVIVLFAMRSDFISNCATYPQLNALLNQQFIQLGAMQPEELVSAIAQPALRVGLRIDPDLIAQIISDLEGEPGVLPLIQFALKDLFDSRQAQGEVIALTLNDYLQRGGIHKSLERHADGSFEELDQNERELARSIFSGLVEIGRGTQDMRRTVLLDELIPANKSAADVKAIVQKLARARLLTTDGHAGKDRVTLAHEKLIDAWSWLKKLVNENRDVSVLQSEIANDAKAWDEHNQDTNYLYSDARLGNAREQLETKKLVLSGLAQEFVQASHRHQRRGQMVLISSSAAALVIIVAILVGWGFTKANQVAIANARATAQAYAGTNALQQANIALARQLASQAQSINAGITSKQMIAVLLATQSMNVFPSSEAAQVLLNNNFAAHSIARMTHNYVVSSVAFSPDGKYVVSGSYDQTARVWEASTGKEVARMTLDGFVYSVAFSPDGKYIVSGSGDYTARVWEASTGGEIARMTHDNDVSSVAFSPDGKYVVSGSYDNSARVWEASTGKEIARMTHDSFVYSVAFSPDGKYVVSGGYDSTARVWEASTGKEVARMTHNDIVRSVAFSPDGKYMVSGSDDNTARVWEASTGREIARMTHDSDVSSVAFSPDGKYVVSGSGDYTARVWEASTGREIARMTHDSDVSSVVFSRDGNYVVSGSGDYTARVWEASTGKEIARMTHDNDVSSLAFSPDGKYVVSGSYDKTARIWRISTDREIARATHTDIVRLVAFSPDGKYVVSGSYDNTARVWDAATGGEISRMTHDSAVSSVAFSPDGKYVVSGSYDNTARVWDAATGGEIARMTHDSAVSSVAFSLDSKYVVSGSGDYTARVWEASTGKEVARMTHDSDVSSVAFSPDGKYVVSGSGDNTARVWEISTGGEVARMTHDSDVNSLAFSPDGKYVVSGSYDDTARVWEASTGKEVARMTHDSFVSSVAFSPDGKYMVSGGGDNTTRIWMWQPSDLIANTCAYLPRNLTRAEWKQYISDALPYQAICPNLPIEPEATP